MKKRHEAEMTDLRKSHVSFRTTLPFLGLVSRRLPYLQEDAIKEQQARAMTEINQLKRELGSFKRNASVSFVLSRKFWFGESFHFRFGVYTRHSRF